MGTKSDTYKLVRSATGKLEAIPAGGSPEAVFDALRACAPVAGGLIGAMRPETNGSVISHVVRLPGDVLEAWASTPRPQLQRMMAPLAAATPGELICDQMAITGRFREDLALLRHMESAGLGESAGYKVATGNATAGPPDHRFLTVALDGNESFTPRQREMFRALHPAIHAALARIGLPIIPHEPLFAQFVEERCIGYLCLSESLSVLEFNDLAHEVAQHCLGSARVEPGRGWLARFAEQAVQETSEGHTWRLQRHDNLARVEIEAIPLARHAHPTSQDLIVLTLRERRLPPRGLARRQLQVANLLTTTDLQYKEIAAEMGIKVSTVGTYVEDVYRAYNVHTRPDLTSLLR